MEEIWKPLKGIVENGDNYEVSNLGQVRRADSHKIMALTTVANGYKRIGLSLKGVKITHSVHRMVALAFIPNPDNKPMVNHKDGVKTNNKLSNLEWATQSENISHAYRNRLVRKQNGELGSAAKLNETKVRELRRLYELDGYSCAKLAEMYGVSSSAVQNVVTYRTWKNVDPDGFFSVDQRRRSGLTETQISDIIQKYKKGLYTITELASIYGVAKSRISDVLPYIPEDPARKLEPVRKDKKVYKKLTEDKVKEIRRLHSTKKYSNKQIADLFEISHWSVYDVVNYKSWKHVE